MEANDFHPIILGSDENAYGMARAFHMRYGIVSTALCKLSLVATRYSKIIDVNVIDGFDKEDVFAASVEKYAIRLSEKYKKLLLIPCSDRYTELASKNRELCEKYFANRFIPFDLLEKFSTKESFYKICDEHGLKYPGTLAVDKADRIAAADNIKWKYPIIVKADNSNSFSYLASKFEGKKKVYFIESREEYLAVVTAMNESGYDGRLILQQYVPGDDTSMRVVNCFSDNGGKVRLMSFARPVIEEYAPLALGNYAAILTDSDEAVCAKLKKFLEDIHYTGFSNFDMKFDPADNEYKLFEINPRQGRSSFSVTASGYNLAEYLTEACVYDKLGETVYAKSDRLWLSVPKKIITSYVKNDEVLSRCKKLFAEKKFDYTLLYKPDMNLKRYLRMKMYYRRHIGEYKRYYFRKD
ncbi:D-aspartate ligase [Clostridia bacterium]|nr:D-aspartate ligase [Clostridia bacterium]